jgi:hypothetical protein
LVGVAKAVGSSDGDSAGISVTVGTSVGNGEGDAAGVRVGDAAESKVAVGGTSVGNGEGDNAEIKVSGAGISVADGEGDNAGSSVAAGKMPPPTNPIDWFARNNCIEFEFAAIRYQCVALFGNRETQFWPLTNDGSIDNNPIPPGNWLRALCCGWNDRCGVSCCGGHNGCLRCSGNRSWYFRYRSCIPWHGWSNATSGKQQLQPNQ